MFIHRTKENQPKQLKSQMVNGVVRKYCSLLAYTSTMLRYFKIAEVLSELL